MSDKKSIRIAGLLCLILLLGHTAVNAAAVVKQASASYVIIISVDGMGSEYVKPLLAGGLSNELTSFKRFQSEGAGTLNARVDADYAVTLPNHIAMLTCRGVLGKSGHHWVDNSDPAPNETLATKLGSYIASGFDVAHNQGLRTAIWSGKSKFSLFQASYGPTTGAPDTVGTDYGRDKIDYDKVVAGISAEALTSDFVSQMTAKPFHFVFFHYQDPDATGHAEGWSKDPASPYATTLKKVDSQIGRILQMVQDNPALKGKTAIILTSDHGGHEKTHGDTRNPLDFTIPFYVWGPGVLPAGDLYAMNPAARTAPGPNDHPPYTGPQPIRNGEAANLALDLLGLHAIPGSTIDIHQDLRVTTKAP